MLVNNGISLNLAFAEYIYLSRLIREIKKETFIFDKNNIFHIIFFLLLNTYFIKTHVLRGEFRGLEVRLIHYLFRINV